MLSSARQALVIGASSLLLLGCGDQPEESGQVDVALSFVEGGNCPGITSAVATPAQTSIGGTVAVNAKGVYHNRGDAVTFNWSPSDRFANPSVAGTTYSCPSAGRQTLTVTLGDSQQPSPCTARTTLVVDCVSGSGAGP